MSTVAEIQQAIERLSPSDREQLKQLLMNENDGRPILEKLRSLAGAARDLPSDLADNHDHYLHGTSKHSVE
jgi:hypothetical protein